jgi:hypothetical protein
MQYPLKTVAMGIRMVVFGLTSLRGTQRALASFAGWFKGGVPCHVAIQNWIMRFGLHRLGRPVAKRADWVYVLDHTIEFGTKQCLLVLGTTLEAFRANRCRLRHRDMTVLAISVVESATGESVRRTLRQVQRKTGTPVQILSDGGPNIRRGTVDFSSSFPGVRCTYDATHQAALILKRHLAQDGQWQSFVEAFCETKRALVHTSLVHLAPPKPRTKARWLNLDIHVAWAEKILRMDRRGWSGKARETYRRRLAWLTRFERPLKEWRAMLGLVQALKREVVANGLSSLTTANYLAAVAAIDVGTPRLAAMKGEVLEYLREECAGLGESPMPGCSDIIESVFGKYKRFSERTPMKEIGKALLTIPVLVKEPDPEEVKEAMESVSTNDVRRWIGKNLGDSLLARRKRAFSLNKQRMMVKFYPDKCLKVASF